MKSHIQIMLLEGEKIEGKDISTLKVDKATSMDVIQSRNFSEFDVVDKETVTKLIENYNKSVIPNES